METKLEECEYCDGQGFVTGYMTVHVLEPVIDKIIRKEFNNMLCPRCRGTGREDWLRKITKSISYEIPGMSEVTEVVRQLVYEDDIFEGNLILYEERRRETLERVTNGLKRRI